MPPLYRRAECQARLDPARSSPCRSSLRPAGDLPSLSLHAFSGLGRGREGQTRAITGAHAMDEGTEELALARERSEEHTSELQSLAYLVCRLLLEKKNRF